MRKNLALFLTACVMALGVVSQFAHATTIEGFTPEGNFQTVGVNDQGALYVTLVSTTPQHVVTDTGSFITTIQNPVQVTGVGGGSVAVFGAFTLTGSTITATQPLTTVPTAAQVVVNGTPAIVYPADAARVNGNFCNLSSTVTIWLGGSGVAPGTGAPLFPLACGSADVPGSFTGNLYGVTTGVSVTSAYIYYK
jgi:hypothetical protein